MMPLTLESQLNEKFKLHMNIISSLGKFSSIFLLFVQFNCATASISEQMPYAEKVVQQPWFRQVAINTMNLTNYGKCGNAFIVFLVAEANGAKFNDDTSLSIALLGKVVGVVRRNFIASGYSDEYLNEVVKSNLITFKEEYSEQCLDLVMNALNTAAEKNQENKIYGVTSGKESDKAIAEGKSTKPNDSGSFGGSTSPRWSYDGELRPENWGREFPICSRGKSQAPINIQGPFVKTNITARVDYKPGLLTMLNNGHTVQVVVPPGSKLHIDEVEYELVQFHFHRPSEEKIDGKSTAMVVHFVHKSSAGKLAILVVFLQEGPENSVLKTLWANLPRAIGNPITFENISFNPANLLPGNFDFYTYEASLSTPPCTEGVRYIVLKTPVSISSNQVQVFPFKSNIRPPQPLNGRAIYSNN